MDATLLTGYLMALLVGLSLGLIGGGGSILTVPILVYILGINPVLATSYSLFIVGTTSLVGAMDYYRKGQVSMRTAAIFGASSITTVFLTRKILLPAIPEKLFEVQGVPITWSLLTMLLFALLMILAAIAMIRERRATAATAAPAVGYSFFQLISAGIGIGLVTGLLGAGGGFLLIPVLVLLLQLPMKKAIGTSLFIIALNSLIGFAGDTGHFPIHWNFLFLITAFAILGIFAGVRLARRFDGEKLKKIFGWFVLLMGCYIFIHEIFLHNA